MIGSNQGAHIPQDMGARTSVSPCHSMTDDIGFGTPDPLAPDSTAFTKCGTSSSLRTASKSTPRPTIDPTDAHHSPQQTEAQVSAFISISAAPLPGRGRRNNCPPSTRFPHVWNQPRRSPPPAHPRPRCALPTTPLAPSARPSPALSVCCPHPTPAYQTSETRGPRIKPDMATNISHPSMLFTHVTPPRPPTPLLLLRGRLLTGRPRRQHATPTGPLSPHTPLPQYSEARPQPRIRRRRTGTSPPASPGTPSTSLGDTLRTLARPLSDRLARSPARPSRTGHGRTRRLCGYRGIRVGEASNPGPATCHFQIKTRQGASVPCAGCDTLCARGILLQTCTKCGAVRCRKCGWATSICAADPDYVPPHHDGLTAVSTAPSDHRPPSNTTAMITDTVEDMAVDPPAPSHIELPLTQPTTPTGVTSPVAANRVDQPTSAFEVPRSVSVRLLGDKNITIRASDGSRHG